MFCRQGKYYRRYGIILYEGQWRNNLHHGQGKYYRQDGSVQYQGQWINDVFKG